MNIKNKIAGQMLIKKIQQNGTVDNATYIEKYGHNGAYALYDMLHTTPNKLSYDKAIDALDMGEFRRDVPIGGQFLHGLCMEMANAIKDTYPDWDMKVLYNKRSIHYYCEYTDNNGTTYYADARGITRNWNEFISEYKDELHTIDRKTLLEEANIRSTTCPSRYPTAYDIAKEYIKTLSNAFNPETIKEACLNKNKDTYIIE